MKQTQTFEEDILLHLDEGASVQDLYAQYADQPEAIAVLDLMTNLQSYAVPAPSKAAFQRLLNVMADEAVTTASAARSEEREASAKKGRWFHALTMHRGILVGVLGALVLSVGVGAYTFVGGGQFRPATSGQSIVSTLNIEETETSFDAELTELAMLSEDELDLEDTLFAVMDLDVTDSAFDVGSTQQVLSADSELNSLALEIEQDLDSFLAELGDLSDIDADIEAMTIESIS